MTEYLRKDSRLSSEQSRIVDANSTDQPTQRTVKAETESAALVTPPPGDLRSGSVTGGSGTSVAAVRAPDEERVALFAANEAGDLRARWDSIQVGFVDEPRKAVQEADALVSDTMKRLAEIFSDERQRLESQWDRREDISTEDFRVALRRYRSFFARLLAI